MLVLRTVEFSTGSGNWIRVLFPLPWNDLFLRLGRKYNLSLPLRMLL